QLPDLPHGPALSGAVFHGKKDRVVAGDRADDVAPRKPVECDRDPVGLARGSVEHDDRVPGSFTREHPFGDAPLVGRLRLGGDADGTLIRAFDLDQLERGDVAAYRTLGDLPAFTREGVRQLFLRADRPGADQLQDLEQALAAVTTHGVSDRLPDPRGDPSP